MTQTRRGEEGGSLIEALVAMLVLALGVMGMAAVQTRTLTTTRTTQLRAVALHAIDDLRDRMQANAERHRILPSSTNPYLTSWDDPVVSTTDCRSLACDSAQLAAFDIAQWKADLARTLPGGNAMVFRAEQDPTQYGVLVAWKEPRAKNEHTATEGQATLYAEAIAVRDAKGQPGTGVAGKECPASHTCHLVYVRP